MISVLEKYYQAKIVPENTLIIFDEIQMCERALTSLKYFSEEAPEYHVMAAGSLLGIAVNREKYSFPVGKVQMLTMYPMDLEEVLWAKGKQMLADTIREHYENNQPLDEILHEAQEKQQTYSEFLSTCLMRELRDKERRSYLTRLKFAGLPARYDLDLYDFSRTEGIDQRQMRELRELVWIRRTYNLLLVGDSGTGKTFIASGLIHEAVKAGYKAYLLTLEELLVCLKTKEISRPAMKTYKRIMKAQLLAIDDVTLFPLKGEDVLLLFKLVNCVQGKTSLIIAASRDLTGWLEMAGDEVCAAALLDRLLYCCEIIRLSGKSYRMENRKTIFSNQQIKTAPKKS